MVSFHSLYLLLFKTATITIEKRIIAAFATPVPTQVIVEEPIREDAELNIVWKSTYADTQPFPAIL